MAYFDTMEKSISWDGAIRLSKNNPGNIEVDTSQLQVRIKAWASLSRNDDSHYLGYVQIITLNEQHNYYGSDVDPRWDFNEIPLSDPFLKQNDHGMVLIQSRTSVVTGVTTFPNLLMAPLNQSANKYER